MTNQRNPQQSRVREAWIVILGAVALVAILGLGLDAQEPIGAPKIKDDKAAKRFLDVERRASIEVSGYTRPGNPDDKSGVDGKIVPATAFASEGLKKFKIMGGTVYFAVFKNMGVTEGDTFGTGMSNFDQRFQEGRSFQNSFSPRYDTRAKYLYLYQVVNDRGLDPRQRPASDKKEAKPEVGFAVDEGVKQEAKVTATEDIASFALKLLVDPRYITSWGHFQGSAFASNVTEVNSTGQVIKQVALDGNVKVEKEREIRLAISHNPAILTKIDHPQYGQRARAYSLNELGVGFGVDRGTLNLQDSKAGQELRQVAGQMSKDGIKLAASMEGRLKATTSVNEPEFVQLMYLTAEERAALASTVNGANVGNNAANLTEDDVTRAIFRVDWRQGDVLKQGNHSVVFGFTTDLPPVNAPIRIDTPTAAQRSEGMRLANYFADSVTDRASGTAPGTGTGTGIVPAAGGVEGAAVAMAVGTALGQAPTPVPAPAGGAAPAGFAGISGGVGSLGGNAPSGGGGGLSVPALGIGGGYTRGGGIGGGGGMTGGTPNNGTGTTDTGNTGTGQNNNTNTINFASTQTNQQAQAQGQFQGQGQHQHGGRGHGGHGGGGGGHVVPAPASLLLGLLGLPGLLLLRRRKADDLPEAAA